MRRPPCCHCDGWGCSRCGSPPPAPVGEQGDRDLVEIDARVAAAVLAERTACVAVAKQWLNRPRCKATALDIAATIEARGKA